VDCSKHYIMGCIFEGVEGESGALCSAAIILVRRQLNILTQCL